MLDFYEPEVQEAPLCCSLFAKQGGSGCDYCFGNTYIWAPAYATKIAIWGGFVFSRSGPDVYHYLFPSGEGDTEAALAAIFEDAAAAGKQFLLYSVSENARNASRYLADSSLFTVREMAEYADFVYAAEDLALLKGGKYHAKRNHVNSFLEDYPDCAFVPITSENIGDCRKINDAWFLEKHGGFDDPEYVAVLRALEQYEALGFAGGVLYARGEPAAFTLGEALTDTMFCTHIEKSAPEFRAAYAVINRAFAQTLAPQYSFINREDSAGDEGLQAAKQSYHPAFMLRKYMLEPTPAFYKSYGIAP